MQLSIPLAPRIAGEPLRVLAYTRESLQGAARPTHLDAIQAFLASANIGPIELQMVRDERPSSQGSAPQLLNAIALGAHDVVVVEDVIRIGRGSQPLAVIRRCAELGKRFISIGDQIDTANQSRDALLKTEMEVPQRLKK